MKAEDPSGTTMEDIIKETLLRFKARREQLNAGGQEKYSQKHQAWEEGGKVGKEPSRPKKLAESFIFIHCYEVVKASSVFMRAFNSTSAPRKRRRSAASSIVNGGGADGDDDDEAFSNLWCMYMLWQLDSGSPSDYVYVVAAVDDGDIAPDDSASNVGASSSVAGSSCAVGSSVGRGLGKKAAKVANEAKHAENSIATSQRLIAESSKRKTELMARQTTALERQALNQERQADMAVITANTEGLTDVAKRLLEMQQRLLLQRMERQMAEGAEHASV